MSPTAVATETVAERILGVLKQVVGLRNAALHEPNFDGDEAAFVKECIDSTFVSTVGKFVDRFEGVLAEFTGAKHVIATSNGTAALHMAMHLAGVEPGDEVIVPALSFVATANAVAHCGAIPHFVDSNPDTMGMDPGALRQYLSRAAEKTAGGLRNRVTGRRISAIVPMHAYGHPVDIAPLVALASDYGVPVVEDAAESLGSYYNGRHTGNFGLLATLSFNGNKIITTGGGGAIMTNDSAIAKRAKHITTTAKRAHKWEFFHDEVAWNYRLPNLNAALGCAQMERLPEFLSLKRKLADRYRAAFEGVPGTRFMSEPKNTISNYWLNTVRISDSSMALRDSVLEAANKAGYQCRPTWTLLHRLPMYTASPKAPLPVAESLEASLINLPSSPALGKQAA